MVVKAKEKERTWAIKRKLKFVQRHKRCMYVAFSEDH